MFSTSERKEKRLTAYEGVVVSDRIYNLIIGVVIAYGFCVNSLIVSFFGDFFSAIPPMLFFVGYFISCLIGSMMSASSKDPIMSFIGYNLIVVPVGALLSTCLPGIDPRIITTAAMMTAGITVLMTAIATAYPTFFEKMGNSLIISLLLSIGSELIGMILGVDVGFFDFIFVGIFSLYIGYDFTVAQRYPKTIDNAVDSSIDLYLDIINIFIRLVSIFARSSDD